MRMPRGGPALAPGGRRALRPVPRDGAARCRGFPDAVGVPAPTSPCAERGGRGAARAAADPRERPLQPPTGGPVRIFRDSGIPLTGPLAALDVWDHQIAVAPAPGDPAKTLWRDRLVIGGAAAPPLWPVLWGMWQWRRRGSRRSRRRGRTILSRPRGGGRGRTHWRWRHRLSGRFRCSGADAAAVRPAGWQSRPRGVLEELHHERAEELLGLRHRDLAAVFDQPGCEVDVRLGGSSSAVH